MDINEISGFLDEKGRVKQMPSKHAKRLQVLSYLAEKFDFDHDYTEKEVNNIISEWHTFEDFFLIRRELIESRLLFRTPNGARYWKKHNENIDNKGEK